MGLPDYPLKRHNVTFSYPRGGETFNVFDTVIFNWTSGYYNPVLNFWAYGSPLFAKHPFGHASVLQNGTYEYAYFDLFTKNIANEIKWPVTMQVWMAESRWRYSDTQNNGPIFTVTSTAARPITYAYASTVRATATATREPLPLLASPEIYKLPTSGLERGQKATNIPYFTASESKMQTAETQPTNLPLRPALANYSANADAGGGSRPNGSDVIPVNTNGGSPYGNGRAGHRSEKGQLHAGLSEGTLIGIGIGIGSVFILLAGFLVIFFTRRKGKGTVDISALQREREALKARLKSDSQGFMASKTSTSHAELEGALEVSPKELPYNSFIREAPDTSGCGTPNSPAELPSPNFIAELSTVTAFEKIGPLR